jgi:Nitrous oxidase accessory protein
MMKSTHSFSFRIVICILCIFAYSPLYPTTYYVDSNTGNDENAGNREQAPWRSLSRVNEAALEPGDSVLLISGGVWREQLKPKSGRLGSPVLYGRYGKGNGPLILGSISKSRADDWTQVDQDIWGTKPYIPIRTHDPISLSEETWHASFQDSSLGSCERVEGPLGTYSRVTCKKRGGKASSIQVWGPEISYTCEYMVIRLKARSSVPLSLQVMEIMTKRSPWSVLAFGKIGERAVGPDWQIMDVLIIPNSATPQNGNLHLYLGNVLRENSTLDIQIVDAYQAKAPDQDAIPNDVGNIVFDSGKTCGRKRWGKSDLKENGDFWYDENNKRLLLFCKGNPASHYSSIEAAENQTIIDFSLRHDVIFDGLAIKYGGAHGFAGTDTENILIRNCDISWIGGGLQYIDSAGNPVRFGNGIEFWGNSHGNRVENNNISEVYDAAVTNQNSNSGAEQKDITYSGNSIWKCEYSFEYWNRPHSSLTDLIIFENNKCRDAGMGWGHSQRPDPNGAHIMLFRNEARTSRVIIRNNTFEYSSGALIRIDNDWRSGLDLYNNTYRQSAKGDVVWWFEGNRLSSDEIDFLF